MKTYILEGRFLENRPTGQAFQTCLAAHHQYLAKGFADGTILLSGPVTNDKGSGGVIVVKSDDIEAFCQRDPFVQAGCSSTGSLRFSSLSGRRGQGLGGVTPGNGCRIRRPMLH